MALFGRILIAVALVAVAVAAVAAFSRRGVRRDADESADVAAVVAHPAETRPQFVTPPPLPATEPTSDRALVARVQALADQPPAEAAPELTAIVKATDDPSALAVAATVARRFPAADAREVFAEMVAKGDAAPPAYRGLAEALAREGKVEEASEAYEQGLAKHPTEFSMREAYARYLAGMGRTDEAAEVCLRGLRGPSGGGEDGKWTMDNGSEGKGTTDDGRGSSRLSPPSPGASEGGKGGPTAGDGRARKGAPTTGGPDTRGNALRRCLLAGEILFAAGRKDEAKAAWERIPGIAETEAEGRRYLGQVLALHGLSR